MKLLVSDSVLPSPFVALAIKHVTIKQLKHNGNMLITLKKNMEKGTTKKQQTVLAV